VIASQVLDIIPRYAVELFLLAYFIFIFYTLVVEFFRYFIFHGSKFKPKYFHLVFTLLLLGWLLQWFTLRDISKVRYGYYMGTKIYTKDSTYISDSSHYYIGKTQNYYFIHNRDNTNMIIPEREVLKFDLQNPPPIFSPDSRLPNR